jgi:hypothetical protein
VRIRKEDICISIHFDEEASEWIATATSSANFTPHKKQMTNFSISHISKISAEDCLIKLLKLIDLE